MGQYYKAVILSEDKNVKTPLLSYKSWAFSMPAKITEHSWLGNVMMNYVEKLFYPESPYYKHRLVWAGDYSKNNLVDGENLYSRSTDSKKIKGLPRLRAGRFIVNHDKKLFVDKKNLTETIPGFTMHPLSLLCADSEQNASGDYCGPDAELVGTWCGDSISIERYKPTSEYKELSVKFVDNF